MTKPRKLSEQLRELLEQLKESDRRSQELLDAYVSESSQRLTQLSLLLEETNG